ncbi:hypothetical protein JTE90_010680 [Oedothorax gibbosus]|uniref:Uncharacterized protein n=1 Tax=Oedothorax gibbosus TaxID=931172 RepID=A0AAV6UR47_9ARAC|nr:hypothetical protein JTE90_010680 [Oedothorax gibbosus]
MQYVTTPKVPQKLMRFHPVLTKMDDVVGRLKTSANGILITTMQGGEHLFHCGTSIFFNSHPSLTQNRMSVLEFGGTETQDENELMTQVTPNVRNCDNSFAMEEVEEDRITPAYLAFNLMQERVGAADYGADVLEVFCTPRPSYKTSLASCGMMDESAGEFSRAGLQDSCWDMY